MAYSNVIVNGDFTLGSAGWSGTDLETTFTERSYLANSSTNSVAELDGNRRAVTVMEQSVSIAEAQTTALTFRTALRTAALRNAGTEGFRVDVLDASGRVVTTQTFHPTVAEWTTQSMPVTFPSGGTYTIRLTELGPDDSFGAIIDDVSLLVCFTSGTLIETDRGARAVETLVPGDLVWTEDAGLQPLRWIGQRRVSQAAQEENAALRPVIFTPGSLGPGQPLRRMALSQQHRLCRADWRTQLYFGAEEVLVPARALVNGDTVRLGLPVGPVTYVHFLFDTHQIVRAEGVLTESFYPSAHAMGGLEAAARAELLGLFPELARAAGAALRTARPALRRRQAALFAA